MGGFKITEQKTNPVELDFEDENNISKSYKTIKTEYRKKGKKLFLVDPNSGITQKLIYMENHLLGRMNR